MTNFIVIVMFVGIIIKQWFYIRMLKVPTKKSILEIVLIILGIFGFVLLTFYSTKEYIHYLICVLGIATFIFIWVKPGITDTGMIMNVRGKELYSWSEIKKVKISKTDYVKVTYFRNSGSKIIAQKFDIKDYEQIINILQNNNVRIENI
ncbi:hypothetical protein [Tissierella praeacuta]|uniref:hypothetical protein n=1 Tax=Tissierella praeacuta TaxID=43131 RepID=UPI001C0FF3F0|nr:hypothetical protein [Tissierella praeacuta]MBU5255831.1 hypothetical protein [Tissierella praeacuta]